MSRDLGKFKENEKAKNEKGIKDHFLRKVRYQKEWRKAKDNVKDPKNENYGLSAKNEFYKIIDNKSVTDEINSIIKSIRKRSEYEKKILDTRLEELKREIDLASKQTSGPELNKLKVKQSKSTIWRSALDAAEVSCRKDINSKLRKFENFAGKGLGSGQQETSIGENAGVSAGGESLVDLKVESFEMPSFSDLRLDDFKRLAVRLKLGQDNHELMNDEKNPVPPDELKDIIKSFGEYVQDLSSIRATEQNRRAQIILLEMIDHKYTNNVNLENREKQAEAIERSQSNVRKYIRHPSGFDGAHLRSDKINDQSKEGAKDSLENVKENYKRLGKDWGPYNQLMKELADRQQSKGQEQSKGQDLLKGHDPKWIGFSRQFKYGTKPETRIAKWLNRLPEGTVRSPQRAALAAVLLSPVYGAEAAGSASLAALGMAAYSIGNGIKHGAGKAVEGIGYLSNRVLNKHDDYTDWRSAKKSKQDGIEELGLAIMMGKIKENKKLRPLEERKRDINRKLRSQNINLDEGQLEQEKEKLKKEINNIKEDKKLLINALKQYHKGKYEEAKDLLSEYKKSHEGYKENAAVDGLQRSELSNGGSSEHGEITSDGGGQINGDGRDKRKVESKRAKSRGALWLAARKIFAGKGGWEGGIPWIVKRVNRKLKKQRSVEISSGTDSRSEA